MVDLPDGSATGARHAHVHGSNVEPHTDGATAMNLMLATLTAKDRVDAFHADADAERLVAPLHAPTASPRGPRHAFGRLTGRLHLTGRGAGA